MVRKIWIAGDKINKPIAKEGFIEFVTSRTRRQILQLFLSNGNSRYYQREVAYLIGRRLHSVQRELKKLVEVGLLLAEACHGRMYYEVNRDFTSLAELRALFGSSAA